MPRHVTAHDLADYARCPRAWWYERHEPLARLDAPALEERLRARRAALGRRGQGEDPEVQVLLRLLERQRRFAHGREMHRQAATRTARRGIGCLPAAAMLLLLLAVFLCW
jgi:hypothetical protein